MGIKILLGQRIKELRAKLNLTQAGLAELVNIDPKHQSCVENGRNYPSADLIEKYAKVFNITPVEMLKMDHLTDRQILTEYIIQLLNSASDKDVRSIYRIVTDIVR